VVDDGGRIVYQNPAVERRLGYSTAELQGRSVLAVHPPNRHDEATTILRDLLAGRGTISPIPLQTKAGDLVPVETRVSRGEWNGRPALFGVSRDMTEWHAAQEALCDSEVLFRAMANSAQDAIAMMDEQGSISFWNKAAERIFGYAPEDAIGQDAHALLAPARYREVFQYAFARWRQTGNGEAIGKTIELVGCRKEGIEFPIELSLASVRLKGCWNAIAIIRDITRRKGLEEALRQRERYQRALLDNFPFLVWLKDTESRFLAVNGPFVAACDQPNADALVGKTDADVWPKDLAERYCADDRDVLASGKSKVIEELVVNKGIRRWMETYKSPVTLAGRVIGIVGFARDISERKQAEEQQRLAASIFAHAHEGIMMIDAAAKIVEINAAFSELTGYSREEVLGRNVRFLQSGRHPPEFYAEMRRTLLETGHWRGEVWNHHKNGQPIATRLTISAARLTISAVQDNSGAITHYVGVFSDITALKESEQRLEFLAYYDALTRLPNRALLADRLGLAIARTERQKDLLAVCYLDLDGFKPVNDLLGHAAGDQLLVAVAERLRRCVRGDDTVARLGGDEFVVLFGGLNGVDGGLNGVDECENAITRLLRTLAVPHALGDRTFEVTASIGVTLYPLDSSDADTLLRHRCCAMPTKPCIAPNKRAAIAICCSAPIEGLCGRILVRLRPARHPATRTGAPTRKLWTFSASCSTSRWRDSRLPQAQCGVTIRLGTSGASRGLPATGGSRLSTSTPAPPSAPLRSASASIASSTSPPRAVLISKASRRISASSSRRISASSHGPSKPRVAGVSGQCRPCGSRIGSGTRPSSGSTVPGR